MNLNEIDKYFRRYDFKSLHKVPEEPGIYCWYGTRKLTEPDWRSPPEDFRRFLAASCTQYRAGALDATLQSSFGLRWQKRIEEVSTSKPKLDLSLANTEETMTEDEDVDIDSTSIQRLVSEVLNRSTPIFSAPLYIGHSRNLQRRINEHKSELENLEETQDEADYPVSQGKTFSQRCHASEFKSGQLSVYILSLEQVCKEMGLTNISSAQKKKVAFFIEHLLNQKYRPLLGRL